VLVETSRAGAPFPHCSSRAARRTAWGWAAGAPAPPQRIINDRTPSVLQVPFGLTNSSRGLGQADVLARGLPKRRCELSRPAPRPVVPRPRRATACGSTCSRHTSDNETEECTTHLRHPHRHPPFPSTPPTNIAHQHLPSTSPTRHSHPLTRRIGFTHVTVRTLLVVAFAPTDCRVFTRAISATTHAMAAHRILTATDTLGRTREARSAALRW